MLRQQIAVVSQDTYLFHGSIEENIRMGRPDASHDDIVAAATVANIHTFITSLPAGYQTLIGEKGIKLSGGQRQRVAIARALLRDAPILVLDEALSAVDAENEAVIQEALDHLMAERTVLILAHRLSSMIDCDRILALDQGRIVESGTHQALMAMGGVYHRLMADQMRDTRGVTANGHRNNGPRTTLEEVAIEVEAPGSPMDRPYRRHLASRRDDVAAGGARIDEADRAVEGQTDSDLPLWGFAGGGVYWRGRPQRPGDFRAENRSAVYRVPVGFGGSGTPGRYPALVRELDGARYGVSAAGGDAHRFFQ